MATNPYFKSYDSLTEQKLIDDLTIETIKATGRDILYIPRDYLVVDNLFGEDPESKFTEGYPLEAYLVNVDRFEGNRDIIMKFGVQITDRATVLISKKRFEEEVKLKRTEIVKPRAGDLIYLPLSKSLFEINYVEDEFPFYQLGGLTTYTLTLELFAYSGEVINTGITDVDEVEKLRNKKTTYAFIDLNPISGNNLVNGESVFQIIGITGGSFINATSTATLLNFIKGSTQNAIHLIEISGGFSFASNQTIRGAESGAEYYFKGSTSPSDTSISQDPFTSKLGGDNDSTQAGGIKIFDFTDIDPFSEGNY